MKPTELAIFARQLSTMISSGMSILRAMYVLEEQTESKYLKETIVAVRKDVEAGLSLSDSMARHPKVFSQLFVAMTQAGETGGVLEDSLVRVADQLQKDAALQAPGEIGDDLSGTRRSTFAIGVMMALVAFLVPVFDGVFKEFGGELPKLTQVSVLMSKAVTQLLVGDVRRHRDRDRRVREVEEDTLGQAAVGPLPPARADEDRHDRPGGVGSALVAHARVAHPRRRAAAAGARDHRPHRRQHRRARKRWTA